MSGFAGPMTIEEAGAVAPASVGRRGRQRAGAIARRLATMVVALAVVLVASFSLVHLIPGDPATRIAGINASPEARAQIRHDLRLDESLPRQFADYVTGVARGRFGESFTQHQEVSEIISSRLPKTLQLAAVSFLLTMLVSIPLGLFVGVATRDGRRRPLDAVFTGATSLIHAVPDYLMATLLVFVFAVSLGLLPVAGADGTLALVLPAVAVAAAPITVLARLTRVETRKVLGLDYIRTARAKRLPAWRVYLVHVLPNVMTSALTLGGLVLTGLIGGTVVVENVFAWPGLGTELVRAINERDYPVIQAIVLLLGIAVIAINAVVDLAIAMLDPRSSIRED